MYTVDERTLLKTVLRCLRLGIKLLSLRFKTERLVRVFEDQLSCKRDKMI